MLPAMPGEIGLIIFHFLFDKKNPGEPWHPSRMKKNGGGGRPHVEKMGFLVGRGLVFIIILFSVVRIFVSIA